MQKSFIRLAFSIAILLFSNFLIAQTPTVGLQYFDESAFDGLMLFTPEGNHSVYLINNCGEKIHEWTFTEKPALTCYLLENGNLLRAGKTSIEIRDWENNVVWSFLKSKLDQNQHHDIEPLPNGNILCVLNDAYSDSVMIALGRDSNLVDPNFRLDKIVEIKPIGADSAEVVWEWKFIDHLIQYVDSTKPNFGVVAEHPELLDVNFDNGYFNDWTHVNAVDYNEDLDQIIISARHLNEIYVIDHSTTTLQAKGSSGGNSNKGGDFLWRWGNPQVYQQGSSSNQKLFLQHDAKWVEKGYLDEGKISVFNNGDGQFSSVHLIEPNINNGNYQLANNQFEPQDFDWTFSGSILGEVINEDKKSGAQSLPNGNFLICETSKGRISEVDKQSNLVWSYVNPTGDTILSQFETPSLNTLFRGEKYPLDYDGFAGKDLTSKGIIENENSISVNCIQSVGIDEIEVKNISTNNPIMDGTIYFNQLTNADKLLIHDINGKIVFESFNYSGNQLKVKLKPGFYFFNIWKRDEVNRIKFISL